MEGVRIGRELSDIILLIIPFERNLLWNSLNIRIFFYSVDPLSIRSNFPRLMQWITEIDCYRISLWTRINDCMEINVQCPDLKALQRALNTPSD